MVDLAAWRHYGLIVDTISGVVFVLLGLFVALVRPRRRVNIAFATFSVALLTLALPLAALMFGRLTDPFAAVNLGPLGVARLAGVALLAYAILKHQLFDIDVKLKWTLKQSTVAAIFIAVFFVASEGAQAAFSERWGTAFGIGAAGALVFAIHPLQHLAERVSDTAMPNVRSDEGALLDKKRAAYREALALAWADGVLNEREAAHLADLRDVLGLSAEEYERLHRERVNRTGGPRGPGRARTSGRS